MPASPCRGDKDDNLGAQYQAGVSVPSFELDLFGRVRSLTNVQLQRYLATEAGARATRLTLVADIASAWLSYAADSSLRLIAEQTAASAEKSVRLTRLRLEGGIAPRTDLRQAEQVLSGAQADLARQRTAVAQDVNALQLLVGAPIDPSLLPGSIDQAFGTIAPVPPGLDSYVLLRRPDVVQAEYELRAANAQIGAARAALFPRITLTGLLGFASSALTKLLTGGGVRVQRRRRRDLHHLPVGRGARQRPPVAKRSATPRSRPTRRPSRPPSAKSPTRSPGAARSTTRSPPGSASRPRPPTLIC